MLAGLALAYNALVAFVLYLRHERARILHEKTRARLWAS